MRQRWWWSLSGSNRRPPACKAGALPAELRPRTARQPPRSVVGRGGFEPPTSRLSGVRSNQLSYRPERADIIATTTISTCRLTLDLIWKGHEDGPWSGATGLIRAGLAKMIFGTNCLERQPARPISLERR
jgi:hypothetical protein